MAQTPETETPPKDPKEALSRQAKHGFYVKKLPKTYEEAYIQALIDPNIQSLNPEIAIARVLLMNYLEHCEGTACVACGHGLPPDLNAVTRTIEGIGRNVERMAGKRKVLTPRGVRFLVEAVARIVYDEVGKDNPKAALNVIDKLKMLKPAQGDYVEQGKLRSA